MDIIVESNESQDVVRQIAEFVQRAAAAERHHAAIMHAGKKIATERSTYTAAVLDGVASQIGSMKVRPKLSPSLISACEETKP
jgi:hypothetical protein